MPTVLGDVRQALPPDLSWIKSMADRHRHELSFVTRATLAAAITNQELLVVEGAGFCHYHRRRDGWHTIYHLVSEKPGTGRVLLNAMPRPTRLKCPIDLEANGFYAYCDGTIVRVEAGKRRQINVWEWL